MTPEQKTIREKLEKIANTSQATVVNPITVMRETAREALALLDSCIVIPKDKVPMRLDSALYVLLNDGAREAIGPERVGVSEPALHELLEAAALLAGAMEE